MRSRVQLAVLRLLSLRLEFTQQELAEALEVVSQSEDDALIESLAKSKAHKQARRSRRSKPLDEQETRLVAELRDTDPKRYRMLKKVDRLLRSGELLPELKSIRSAGMEIRKDFNAGRSRREAIPRLIQLLATEPLEDIRAALDRWSTEGLRGKVEDHGYQRLADYLIHGQKGKKE